MLAAARDRTSLGYQLIADRMGTDTNPFWITAQAAETAYDRGLMDETEFDYLTR